MKQDYLNKMRTLSKEHKKVKETVLQMCDDLDKADDFKEKEKIKLAIDKSRKHLDTIENAFSDIINKISEK